MKTIKLCIFDPLHNQIAEPVIIEITESIPEFEGKGEEFYKNAMDFYQQQAESLCQALHNSLPQGTFDRLWIEFMKIKTSLYRGKTDS